MACSHHSTQPARSGDAPECCPRCGGPKNCQLCTAAADHDPCWGATVSIPDALLTQVPAEFADHAYFCRHGVENFQHAKEGAVAGSSLRPGDCYFDNGLMVFTAEYHRRRGHCCGNHCRHCPYQTELAGT